jgi:hypothetical protein
MTFRFRVRRGVDTTWVQTLRADDDFAKQLATDTMRRWLIQSISLSLLERLHEKLGSWWHNGLCVIEACGLQAWHLQQLSSVPSRPHSAFQSASMDFVDPQGIDFQCGDAVHIARPLLGRTSPLTARCIGCQTSSHDRPMGCAGLRAARASMVLQFSRRLYVADHLPGSSARICSVWGSRHRAAEDLVGGRLCPCS